MGFPANGMAKDEETKTGTESLGANRDGGADVVKEAGSQAI